MRVDGSDTKNKIMFQWSGHEFEILCGTLKSARLRSQYCNCTPMLKNPNKKILQIYMNFPQGSLVIHFGYILRSTHLKKKSCTVYNAMNHPLALKIL